MDLWGPEVMVTLIQNRLAGFTAAIVMRALLVGWAAQTGWRRGEQLNEEIRNEQLESFRVADQFQAGLQRLGALLLRYGRHQRLATIPGTAAGTGRMARAAT